MLKGVEGLPVIIGGGKRREVIVGLVEVVAIACPVQCGVRASSIWLVVDSGDVDRGVGKRT